MVQRIYTEEMTPSMVGLKAVVVDVSVYYDGIDDWQAEKIVRAVGYPTPSILWFWEIP